MCRNYNSSYKGYPPNNPNNSTRSNCLSAPPDAVPFVPIPIVYDNCIYVEVYLLLDAYGMNSNGSGPYPDTMPPVPVYPQRSPPVFIAHPDYPPRMPSAHAYPVYPSDDYEPHPSYYPPRRLQIESVPPLSVMDTSTSTSYSEPRHSRHSQPNPSTDSSGSCHPQRSDSHNRRKSNRRTSDRSTPNGRHSSHAPSLSDYEDSILDLALQQKGCRMLQRELDLKGVSMVDIIYRAIGDQINLLVMDQYGNYLFQKLIDLSNDDQKREVVGDCLVIQL